MKKSVEKKYSIVATPPAWDEKKVERILKSHAPLSQTDVKELHKAIDYLEYLNSESEDDATLEKVTDQLVQIAERLEIPDEEKRLLQ